MVVAVSHYVAPVSGRSGPIVRDFIQQNDNPMKETSPCARPPQQGTQTPSPLRTSSPLKPRINRELTWRLVQQTGAFTSKTGGCGGEQYRVVGLDGF